MDEAGAWIWIHTGENRAINLHHVSDIAFEHGDVLRAHLCVPSLGTDPMEGPAQRVTLEGPEAEALRSYLARLARHLEDLAAD
ncbi:MAG TPA: hypothetical protein VFE42_22045 [Chloroflexota bacterium]|nr:hypothetical protein [Chloroflexota bacterium]